MSQSIAFFDFDGTLTYKDSFIELIKYQKGKINFYVGFTILLPILIFYKLKLIANWKAKEIVLQYFFKNQLLQEFNQKCEVFSKTHIPQMLRPEAINKLKWHQSQGHEVVIVSASAVNWLQYWTSDLNLVLIGTELESIDGKMTGKILGKNCFGIEKANRIREKFNLGAYKEIYAYGDSNGDKEMLALANYSFYKEFGNLVP